MIHAPRPGEQVEVIDVYATPVAIRRVLPDRLDRRVADRSVPRPSMGSLRSVPFSGLFQAAAGSTAYRPPCSRPWPSRSPATTPAR